MKRNLLISIAICISIFIPSLSLGATARLSFSWAASPESDVIGYCLYYSTSGSLSSFKNCTLSHRIKIIKAPATQASIFVTASSGTEIFFAITAIDSSGNESPFSREIIFVMPHSNSGEKSRIVSNSLELIIKNIK